jgi:hypothetical protein
LRYAWACRKPIPSHQISAPLGRLSPVRWCNLGYGCLQRRERHAQNTRFRFPELCFRLGRTRRRNNRAASRGTAPRSQESSNGGDVPGWGCSANDFASFHPQRLAVSARFVMPCLSCAANPGLLFFASGGMRLGQPRLSAYSLPSIGATCGGSRSRYGRPIPSSFS